MPSAENESAVRLQRIRITAAYLFETPSLSFDCGMKQIDACSAFVKCFDASGKIVLIRGLRLEFRSNCWCNPAADSEETGYQQAVCDSPL
ncbi:MAG: hypothetical protein DWI00_10665 [Planctomycetota bacterium]|nr:MAG: hypothetical protein DWI00_10665 [Planctomycetota bacterium]